MSIRGVSQGGQAFLIVVIGVGDEGFFYILLARISRITRIFVVFYPFRKKGKKQSAFGRVKRDLYRHKRFFGVQFPGPLRVAGHREHQVWLGIGFFIRPWTRG